MSKGKAQHKKSRDMIDTKKIGVLYCILTFATIIPNSSLPFLRFYYLNHLIKSSRLLFFLDTKDYYYQPCNCSPQDNCIQIDSAFFFHDQIKICIQTMQDVQSLKPILYLLQDVKKYTHLEDIQFIREFFVLIFIIHKQILLDECKKNPQALKKVTLETILEISEKINQLPIAEVLNAIDMLVTELPPFLEKYEFNSKITWKAWLKKYWWVLPIFGGWFALKILLSLQRPHYYFSPYLSPRPTIPLPPVTTNDPVLAEIIVVKEK